MLGKEFFTVVGRILTPPPLQKLTLWVFRVCKQNNSKFSTYSFKVYRTNKQCCRWLYLYLYKPIKIICFLNSLLHYTPIWIHNMIGGWQHRIIKRAHFQTSLIKNNAITATPFLIDFCLNS